MAARELLKLCASPPTVSPRERRSWPWSRRPPPSDTRRERSRAQLLSVRMERSSSTLVRDICRAMSWISSWSAKRSGCLGGAGSVPPLIQRPSFSRTRPTRRRLEVHQLGHPLAMPGGIAEGELRPFGPLEVQVQVVLPGEADAAVELDARAGHAPV